MAKRKRSKPESAEISPTVGTTTPEPALIEPEAPPGAASASALEPFDEPALGEVVVVPPAMAANVEPEAPVPTMTAEPATGPKQPTAQPMLRKNWFALRVVAIAVLAALGGAAGSLAPSWFDRTPALSEAVAPVPDHAIALQETVAVLAAEVAALRSAVLAAKKNTEDSLAAVTERLDTSETMQGALVERVTRIAESFAPQPKAVAASEVTGSITPDAPKIVRGWTLWRVYGGRALVEGRGAYFEVVPGSDLPGLGTVKRIARSDGRWVVITSRGIIVPAEG